VERAGGEWHVAWSAPPWNCLVAWNSPPGNCLVAWNSPPGNCLDAWNAPAGDRSCGVERASRGTVLWRGARLRGTVLSREARRRGTVLSRGSRLRGTVLSRGSRRRGTVLSRGSRRRGTVLTRRRARGVASRVGRRGARMRGPRPDGGRSPESARSCATRPQGACRAAHARLSVGTVVPRLPARQRRPWNGLTRAHCGASGGVRRGVSRGATRLGRVAAQPRAPVGWSTP
jgi:hypothetical protein